MPTEKNTDQTENNFDIKTDTYFGFEIIALDLILDKLIGKMKLISFCAIILVILALFSVNVLSSSDVKPEFWKGTETFASGDIYDGEMVNGIKSGQGRYIWVSGDSYEGEWREDNLNGNGVFRYADGSVYDGEWADGERTGFGFYKSVDGNLYIGHWLGGMVHGHGQLTQAGGEIYEGEKEKKRISKNFIDFLLSFLL